MDSEKKYNAKLMLAGEYGVIQGGEALTVPLKQFYAQIAHRDSEPYQDNVNKSVASLRKLFSYIRSLPTNSFYAVPKIGEMDDMLKKGFYISSNIPHGYGIGSSGAVSALVYDQFFDNTQSLTLQKQRKDLATIESYFHGKSSGVDAMSCFYGQPLHFLAGGEIFSPETDPIRPPGGYRFFLLDSGEVFDTGPLVKIFLENMRTEEYRKIITDDYLPLISKLIEILTGKKEGDPALVFRAISDLQWNHFRDMIPEKMEDSWIEGQVSNIYYLKLNGSGGGFMLGIAHEESLETVNEMLEESRIIWL